MLIIIAWWLNIYSSQQPLMIMSWESNTKAILDPSSKPTLYFVPTKHIHNTYIHVPILVFIDTPAQGIISIFITIQAILWGLSQ